MAENSGVSVGERLEGYCRFSWSTDSDALVRARLYKLNSVKQWLGVV